MTRYAAEAGDARGDDEDAERPECNGHRPAIQIPPVTSRSSFAIVRDAATVTCQPRPGSGVGERRPGSGACRTESTVLFGPRSAAGDRAADEGVIDAGGRTSRCSDRCTRNGGCTAFMRATDPLRYDPGRGLRRCRIPDRVRHPFSTCRRRPRPSSCPATTARLLAGTYNSMPWRCPTWFSSLACLLLRLHVASGSHMWTVDRRAYGRRRHAGQGPGSARGRARPSTTWPPNGRAVRFWRRFADAGRARRGRVESVRAAEHQPSNRSRSTG